MESRTLTSMASEGAAGLIVERAIEVVHPRAESEDLREHSGGGTSARCFARSGVGQLRGKLEFAKDQAEYRRLIVELFHY